MDPDDVASAFGLGRAMSPLTVAARGWGGHNVVYRLATADGIWAIKAVLRETDGLMEEHWDVEMAAFGGGIPMPRPVRAVGGRWGAEVAGRILRCHEWVDGSAKTNEETTVEESRRMGQIMASLHGLELGWPPSLDGRPVADESSWAEYAEAGVRRGARWALTIKENLAGLDALSGSVRNWRAQEHPGRRVGSHRDLNAHNVLFGPGGLSLVDWDAAGPISPPWELANYATLWASRLDDSYDLEALRAFLDGYRDGGGEITGDEPDTLVALVDNVEWWTRSNVRWALGSPTEDQDANVECLIRDLLETPAVVDERRRVLRDAVHGSHVHLDPGMELTEGSPPMILERLDHP